MQNSHTQIIGFKIRLQRNCRKLSQQQLAFLLNRDRSYISRVETGKQEIDASTLFAIAYYLDCSVEDFNPYSKTSVLIKESVRTYQAEGLRSEVASDLQTPRSGETPDGLSSQLYNKISDWTPETISSSLQISDI